MNIFGRLLDGKISAPALAKEPGTGRSNWSGCDGHVAWQKQMITTGDSIPESYPAQTEDTAWQLMSTIGILVQYGESLVT
jgi:hypothetical protein